MGESDQDAGPHVGITQDLGQTGKSTARDAGTPMGWVRHADARSQVVRLTHAVGRCDGRLKLSGPAVGQSPDRRSWRRSGSLGPETEGPAHLRWALAERTY